VLGSQNGSYTFYVVPSAQSYLKITSPQPGFLAFSDPLEPVTINGLVPSGLSSVTVDYTISMPGFILEQGQVSPSGNSFQIIFDPAVLAQDFPNLDLTGRDRWRPGLSDTFAIGLLLRGTTGGQTVHFANAITLQGEQVFVDNVNPVIQMVYLPLVRR
jgi:hypothetical protein